MGPASFMLSYSWSYSVIDVIDSLKQFCSRHGLEPKCTYFWVDFLCVNQHRIEEKKSKGEVVSLDILRKTFRSQIEGTGKVLAIMTPWDCPHYPTRVWCVFEMFTAISLGDACEVFVTMPPHQEKCILKELTTGNDGVMRVWQMLSNIRVQDAKASFDSESRSYLKVN